MFPALWIPYLGYWRVAARKVKTAERVESAASRGVRVICILLAFALLALPKLPLPPLDLRWLPREDSWFWLGAALCAAGLLFSVWARRHLGNNWSQAVTIKQCHEVID